MPALVRLLEVSVLAIEPMCWRWRVSQGETEIAGGYEDSREDAQSKGDSTLFWSALKTPKATKRSISQSGTEVHSWIQTIYD
jgi:hypothetical protein